MATTSLNPGVGPTNADIATAVAAPSAATIAAAVAAPSAATIASAVAAPSSATIASAVAAAVPTISAINSSVAANAPSPYAWTLIASTTPSNTANNVVFSGLSGYKSYKILTGRTFCQGAAGAQYLRINSDTGSFYNGFGMQAPQGSYAVPVFYPSQSQGFIIGSVDTSQSYIANIIINNANLAGTKEIQSKFVHLNANGFFDLVGSYRTTSTITSIGLHNSGAGNLDGSTIYLYGAN
jgi:hypothetical protein